MRHLQLNRGAGFRRRNNEQELRRPTLKCLSFKRFLEIRSKHHPNWITEPAVRLINSWAALRGRQSWTLIPFEAVFTKMTSDGQFNAINKGLYVKSRIMLSTLGMLMLCGCLIRPGVTSPNIGGKTVSEFQAGTRVGHDDFGKTTLVKGYSVSFVNAPLRQADLNARSFGLIAREADSLKTVEYSLEFSTERGKAKGPASWDSALDANGQHLPVIKEPPLSGSGDIWECVAVVLTREYLDAHATSGFHICIEGKADGKTTRQRLFVPGNYIVGFLRVVDATFSHGQRSQSKPPNQRPGADAGWSVLFAFGGPWPRAAQADR